MRIVSTYSHLNGEEFLLVHHKAVYREVIEVVKTVDAGQLKTKVSEEKTMKGRLLYSPDALNGEFRRLLRQSHWQEKHYAYYIATDHKTVREIIDLPLIQQRKFLMEKGIKEPIQSYKQTDFVKDHIAIEV